MLWLEQLLVVAVAAGMLTVFVDVADGSFLPAAAPREDSPEGAAKLTLSGGSLSRWGRSRKCQSMLDDRHTAAAAGFLCR